MGVLRYALLDVLRGRRRTFSSILGVLLAITFLAGTFIAIDSSARATLKGLLDEALVDFHVLSPPGSSAAMRDAVEAVPGVREATVYETVGITVRSSDGDVVREFSVEVLAVDPQNLPAGLREGSVMGALDLPRGSVAVSSHLASELGVELEEQVTFRHAVFDPVEQERVVRWLNLTLTAVVTPPPEVPSGYIPPWDFGLIHLGDVEWFRDQLGVSPFQGYLLGDVWVDRDRFIDPYDLEGSRRELARFERQLSLAVAPFNGTVTDVVSRVLLTYESISSYQRVIFLVLSLPVLLLGLYLGAVGVDLGHAERRRELAVLNSRGASRGQVLGLLLLEAAFGGVLAALLGLLAGTALSRLLLQVVNPFAVETAPLLADLVLSPGTVITVAVFSVLFMLLASYHSAKRTARLSVVETLGHYAPGETKIEYRPTTDVVLLGIGAGAFVGFWYTLSQPGTLPVFLLAPVFVILLPVAPILLIVGGTRFLTRSSGRVYTWASRIWKPVAGSLYPLISRNLGRNPRRSSNVAIIIALGLAFGMFIFSFLGTGLANQERSIRASLGADMVIGSWPATDATFVDNVAALPQVADATTVQRLRLTLFGTSQDVWALNPGAHFRVTQPEAWWFGGLPPDRAAAILREGEVLASKRAVETLFLEVGDRVVLSSPGFNATTGEPETISRTYVVGGVVRALPGTTRGAFGLPVALYASFDALAPFLAPEKEEAFPLQPEDASILVDLHADADWRAARAAVQELGGTNVRVYEEERERQMGDPVSGSILGFIRLETAFIVVILTAGLGLILFAATLERDVEFAAIRARGASGWQTAGVLLGESVSIMVIGLAIGVTVGLLVAYTLFQLVFLGPLGATEPLVPFLFEVPLEGLLLVILAPMAMLLTSLLVAWRIAAMNVARVLKVRGG